MKGPQGKAPQWIKSTVVRLFQATPLLSPMKPMPRRPHRPCTRPTGQPGMGSSHMEVRQVAPAAWRPGAPARLCAHASPAPGPPRPSAPPAQHGRAVLGPSCPAGMCLAGAVMRLCAILQALHITLHALLRLPVPQRMPHVLCVTIKGLPIMWHCTVWSVKQVKRHHLISTQLPNCIRSVGSSWAAIKPLQAPPCQPSGFRHTRAAVPCSTSGLHTAPQGPFAAPCTGDSPLAWRAAWR